MVKARYAGELLDEMFDTARKVLVRNISIPSFHAQDAMLSTEVQEALEHRRRFEKIMKSTATSHETGEEGEESVGTGESKTRAKKRAKKLGEEEKGAAQMVAASESQPAGPMAARSRKRLYFE